MRANGSDYGKAGYNSEIVKMWWAYMDDIMDTNPDNSPVCKPLQEVFHQD